MPKIKLKIHGTRLKRLQFKCLRVSVCGFECANVSVWVCECVSGYSTNEALALRMAKIPLEWETAKENANNEG